MLTNPLFVRVAAVWALAIIFTGVLSGIWFIFQPAFTYTTMVMNATMYAMNVNSTNSDRVVVLLRLAINVSIPIMIIAVWGWAFISSHKDEPRGEYA